MRYFRIFLLMFLIIPHSVFAADYDGVVINEILAANVLSNMDPRTYNYGDWIEIYNGSSERVDLRSCFLTDDPEIRMARALSRDQESVVGFEGMIGESPAMLKLFALIQKVAPTTGTV
ncbi:hypothetical protein K8I31_03725, partial [bacterium]|nr:hypothetical protein [bacterium]